MPPAWGRGGDRIYQESVTSQALLLQLGVCHKPGRDDGMLYRDTSVVGIPRGSLGCPDFLHLLGDSVSGFFPASRTFPIQDASSSLPPPSPSPVQDEKIHHDAVWSTRTSICPLVFFVFLARTSGSLGQGCTYRTLNAHLSEQWNLRSIKRKSLAWGGKAFGRVL